MAKFNVVQKKKRAQTAERKRAVYGDPSTRKLNTKPQKQTLSISGKRKRKLLKKWRRAQKDAVDKGLLTIEDVEMAAAYEEEEEPQEANKTSTKFPIKKALKLKQLKRRGKNKRKSSKPATEAEASADAMVE